jgi:hypothetical protein
MRIRKPLALGLCTAVLGAAAASLLALPASATSTPPWEPDPNAVGTLTFYNSAGDVVTSGSNLDHLFDYAEASTTDPDGPSLKATLQFANPQPGIPTGDFFVGQASLSTDYPNANAPAPLNTTPNPVVTLGPDDADLAAYIPTAEPNTEAGYENVYQIRMVTSGGTGGGTAPGNYWDADVMVNPTAGTWVETYPVQGTSSATTTTTLAVSPSTSAEQGASVTLTATEIASDSTHPAGTVQFIEDTFDVGSPVTVNSSGVATLTTTTLPPSAPNGLALEAVFTPTDTASYAGSTGTASYTVNPVAAKPTLSGPHQVGGTETCNEGSLDFGVNATYTWLVSGKAAGKPSKSDTFTVPGTAYKKALSCVASVSAGTGPVSSATSSSVTVSLGKAPTALKNKGPALSGPHAVGKVEKVSSGTWSVKGLSFSYQWLLNGKPIKGATKSSLKLTSSEKGKTLSCRVTAKATGYANGVATTKGVKVT